MSVRALMIAIANMNIQAEIEKLVKLINDSDLSDNTKNEATALLKYNILKEHQIRQYNEGCRPDGLN